MPSCHVHFTSVTTKALLLFAMLPIAAAHAVPFATDISITGSTTFDDSFSFGPTSGDFGVTEGGSTTTSTFADTSVLTGTNPLPGTLTDISDGFGFSGTASAVDEAFGIGIDTAITVANSSATDAYEVIFSISFDNAVDAGFDGFSFSELTVDFDGSEVFFSHLESDSLFGDAVGDRDTGLLDPTGTSGEELLDADSFLLPTITLAAGASLDVFYSWTFEGEDFAGGTTTGSLGTFLSVAEVTSLTPPVITPEPGILLLMFSGLLGLPLARKLRR